MPHVIRPKYVIGQRLRFRPVELTDADYLVSLRTNIERAKYLSVVSSSADAQREWIEKYLQDTNQAYFIIESKDQLPLGAVRIYDPRQCSFSWGSWIIQPGAPTSTGIESALMIYRFALEKLGFERAHFEVYKQNRSVLAFHLKFGAAQVGTGANPEQIQLEISKEQILASISRFSRYLPNGIKVEH